MARRRARRASSAGFASSLGCLRALGIALLLVALPVSLRARQPLFTAPRPEANSAASSAADTAATQRRAQPANVSSLAALPAAPVSTLSPVADWTPMRLPRHQQLLTSVLRCNCTRVAEALYKIVKLFGVRTLCDVPAASHASWMLPVVNRLTFETPSFRYIAIDDDHALLRNVARRYQHVVDAEFVPGLQPRSLQACELLFYWPACGAAWHAAQTQSTLRVLQHAPAVLRMAKDARCALMLFPQTPDAPRNRTLAFRAGRWTVMEKARSPAARPPFMLNDFVKGAIPIGNLTHRDALYMTLYSLSAIPRAALSMRP